MHLVLLLATLWWAYDAVCGSECVVPESTWTVDVEESFDENVEEEISESFIGSLLSACSVDCGEAVQLRLPVGVHEFFSCPISSRPYGWSMPLRI